MTRAAVLALIVLLPACVADGEPEDVRTCYDGSYEPLGVGSVVTEPPC